jgi:hypothetical protein
MVKVDAPVRGDVALMLREFHTRCPDARVVLVEHDDGCPGIGTGERCTCEIVVLHVEGDVPEEVVW